MTTPDDWEPVESFPARPITVEELDHIETQYGPKAKAWIEVNIEHTKSELGLDDVGKETIINFVIINGESRYQYRFNGEQWVVKGPFPDKYGAPTWYSEAGSLWMALEKLLKKN